MDNKVEPENIDQTKQNITKIERPNAEHDFDLNFHNSHYDYDYKSKYNPNDSDYDSDDDDICRG